MARHVNTWFITGASSGLGLAFAEKALEEGDQVVLAARSQQTMKAVVARFPDTALAIEMDITDREQRATAVRVAETRFGRIDVLINNAGVDFLGAIEEQREEDYRRTFEVNVFGAVEMIRLVLPGMRGRRAGTIVNISSMDGFSSVAANGFYSASKFALEGLSDALSQEIEPLGLRAISVQPGSFRTGIELRTQFSGQTIEDYCATSGAFRTLVSKASPEQFPGDPARAAAVIFDVISSNAPPRRVVLGSDAFRRIDLKLEALRRELDAGRAVALSTDFPGSVAPIL
jgi:NAD(P)-dependent dehydrogenase (short-subunit alcohol dehydrogenase family)